MQGKRKTINDETNKPAIWKSKNTLKWSQNRTLKIRVSDRNNYKSKFTLEESNLTYWILTQSNFFPCLGLVFNTWTYWEGSPETPAFNIQLDKASANSLNFSICNLLLKLKWSKDSWIFFRQVYTNERVISTSVNQGLCYLLNGTMEFDFESQLRHQIFNKILLRRSWRSKIYWNAFQVLETWCRPPNKNQVNKKLPN